MFIEYDFDSIFETIEEEIVAPTKTTNLTATNVKIIAPEELRPTAEDATEYDFLITEKEYKAKKLSDTVIDAIEGLKFATDYSLTYKLYQTIGKKVSTPALSDSEIPNQIIAIDNYFKSLEWLKSNNTAIGIFKWKVFGSGLTTPAWDGGWYKIFRNFQADTSKVRWLPGMDKLPEHESYLSMYKLMNTIANEKITWSQGTTTPPPALIDGLLSVIGPLFRVITNTPIAYDYAVQVSYKIKQEQLTDVVINQTTLQATTDTLNKFFNSFNNKIKNHFTVTKTEDISAQSIRNGSSVTTTTVTFNEISPNDDFYPSGLNPKKNPNPKITTATKKISNQAFTIPTKKYTYKNSDGSIWFQMYYSMQKYIPETSYDGTPIDPIYFYPQHCIMIDTFNDDPTNPNAKKIYQDPTQWGAMLPNIGGDSQLTLTNVPSGKLYISLNDHHLCITSRIDKKANTNKWLYFSYFITKFTHTNITPSQEWFNDNNVPSLVSLRLKPTYEDTTGNKILPHAFAPLKYDPFKSEYYYGKDAMYKVFYYNKFYGNLIYVNDDNKNQLILSPILINDHKLGIFGNLSSFSDVYMIMGKSSLKPAENFTTKDGKEFMRFGNHAVRIK